MNQLTGQPNQCFGTELIPHAVEGCVSVQTSQVYTKPPCVCTVKGFSMTITIEYSDIDCEYTAGKIPVPHYCVTGCQDASFTGFKITALPLKGILCINTVPVIIGQVLSKQDFANLEFKLTTEEETTDSFKYEIVTTCGTSPVQTVTLNIAKGCDCGCITDDDCGCDDDITTTIPVTTTIP